MHISDELFDKYKPGTKPEGIVSKEEANQLKLFLTSLISLTVGDFYNGRFVLFNERLTGTGFHLASLKDAFEFNNYHEALHLGCMMSIRKFI